jgi:WD40 repeat protein
MWDLTRNAVPEVSRNFASLRRGFAVSPKAEFLAVVNDDATVSFWDLIGRRETGRFPVEPGTTVLASSPTGKAVVLGGQPGQVWMHRVDTANGDIQIDGPRADKALATFSPDGAKFAVGGREQLLRVGTTDGSAPVRVLKHPIDMMTEILFSLDGRLVFAANESGWVRICDAETGEIVRDFRAHEHVTAGLALDADSRQLATTSSDGTVGLWDLSTGRKLGSYGKSSIGYLSVSFSWDGKRIAASSGEGPVKIWDVASGLEVARFKGAERVLNVRFAADDRTLAMATVDQLSLFRAPTFAEIAAAEAGELKGQRDQVESIHLK